MTSTIYREERLVSAQEFEYAVAQARKSASEGGVPIGAALVVDGTVVGVGHNQRVQMASAIRHGEMDCLENAGRLQPDDYRRATLYTTTSPCQMCAGTILMYGIPRVVIGESRHFCENEEYLRSKGVEVLVLDDAECYELLETFIATRPDIWAEDIAEDVDKIDTRRGDLV